MPRTKRRILCVDDNEDTCFMLTALLGQYEYEAITADSIGNALRLAENDQFDLYILDKRFEHGSGIDLCRTIREIDPATPILFYSGDAHYSDREEALKAGAQEYVAKPDIDKLLEAIQRLLQTNQN